MAFRGSMVYWYNSTSFRDDLAWAASWMYKATRDPDYLGDAYGFWDTHKTLEGDYDIRYLVSPPIPTYPERHQETAHSLGNSHLMKAC